MKRVLSTLCLLLIAHTAQAQVVINEIRIDEPGTDINEFFELSGTPGELLDGLTYVVIGDSTGSMSGNLEFALPLDGNSLNASGYFVAAEDTFVLGIADLTTDLVFENSDNVTHLVVTGFSGTVGDDLDTDDDGVLDVTPWTGIVDLIALVEQDNPPTFTEFHYGPPQIGPEGGFVPSYVRRCPDTTGTWLAGTFGIQTPIQDETPGVSNDSTCPSCLAVLPLDCVSDCTVPSVTLTWTNSDTYSDVEIYRNGLLIDTIAGTLETYEDLTAPAGAHEYEVVGICDISGTPTPSPATSCSLIHSPYSGEQHIIFVGEEAGGSVNSVQALVDAFGALGETYLLIDRIETFACFDTFGAPGNIIWLMLGTNPNDYELTPGDATVLTGLVDAGVGCYLEGADHFVWAPITTFHDYDGCDNAISMPGVSGTPAEGDDTLTLLTGATHAGLDLSALIDVPYMQDNDGGNDYTDRLVPATMDALGTNIGPIWANVPDLLPDPAVVEEVYDVGLYYVTDGIAGNVIATSFEFGGVQDDLIDLMINYKNALLPGIAPTDQFRRGDANADSAYDISDAVFTLAALFTPGSPAPSCADSGDSNDDGAFDISDAVFTLAALFTPGAPAPSAPAPNCGGDPTPDSLDCAIFDPCP
ncbi:MAG: hypothetical protein AAF488_10690 [Planctomycetota bacterium]